MIGIQLCDCITFEIIADLLLPLGLSSHFPTVLSIAIDGSFIENAAALGDRNLAAGLGARVDFHAVDIAAYLVHGSVLRKFRKRADSKE